jgi:hypothetical protein
MNLKQKICDALCSGFIVREVPIGFSLSSPFDWFSGDKLTFYARIEGQLLRFEDSGSTIFDLESAGVDLSTSSRLEILEELKSEFKVSFDQNEIIFHSDWLDNQNVGYEAVKFLSFLHRVQDLTFTTRDRISSTFREDLISALQQRFEGSAEMAFGEAPVHSLGYYVVDILVKHRSGKIAAIFPGTSEQKALEAVLFAKELELKNIDNVIPFLIYEKADASKINKQTQAKALNSDLQLAAWEGGHREVVDKVARHVSISAAP